MKYLLNEVKNNIKNYIIFKTKTKDELQESIDLGRLNKKKALKNYGHISTCNTILITYMIYLFNCETDSNLV